jgi:hypothetical protein
VSDNYDEFDDMDDNGPAGLREALKKAKAALKARDKEVEDLKSATATLQAQVKKSTLADLLKSAGIDPKFAARADRDGAEPTEEGVKSWVEENKDFYNFGQPAAAEKPAETPAPADGQPSIPDGMEQAIRQAQGIDSSSITPSEVDIVQKLASVNTNPRQTSEDQLKEQLRALGIDLTA